MVSNAGELAGGGILGLIALFVIFSRFARYIWQLLFEFIGYLLPIIGLGLLFGFGYLIYFLFHL